MKAPPPPPGPPPPLIERTPPLQTPPPPEPPLPSIQTPPPLQTPPDAAASQNLTSVQSDDCLKTRAERVDQGTSVQSLDFGKPLAASGNATPRDTLGRNIVE